jgi:tetratricopeptide (TPR) repeat protein
VPAPAANISYSFVKLQRLELGFDGLCDGTPGRAGHERTLRRLVDQLGATAIPLLLRRLCAANDDEAGWAARLLGQLGERDDTRPRVTEELRALAQRGEVSALARCRAAALLADIAGEILDHHAAPAALRDHSLRELARRLDTAAEVARAADLLAGQLEDHELLDFVDDFAASEPRRAAALLEELLARDDVEEPTRSELRRLRAPLPRPDAPARMPGAYAYVGAADDGRVAVVAAVRRPGSRPARYRALWCMLAADGTLIRAGYHAELTRSAISRAIVEPAHDAGFALARAALRHGASMVAAGARHALTHGQTVPRDYYLGRDILGLRVEHWPTTRETDEELALLLGRSVDLVALGEYGRARPLLDRYVARRPDDPDARANLGLCLLATGDPAAGLRHLRRAAWLEPHEALHHWNVAAAARAARQPGRCYLALQCYLERDDPRDGAHERARAARAAMTEYERLARLEHPNAEPATAARADALIARGRAHAVSGRVEAAIASFERVVTLVADHRRAWHELGELYLTRSRHADALRCLEAAACLGPLDAELAARLAALRARA